MQIPAVPREVLLLSSKVGLDKETSVLKFPRSSRREREPLIRSIFQNIL
jgi:hypothetical protein